MAEETVPIELMDVNDNIPTFENTDDNGYIIGSVIESTPVNGALVVTLTANDSDITPAYKTVSMLEFPIERMQVNYNWRPNAPFSILVFLFAQKNSSFRNMFLIQYLVPNITIATFSSLFIVQLDVLLPQSNQFGVS